MFHIKQTIKFIKNILFFYVCMLMNILYSKIIFFIILIQMFLGKLYRFSFSLIKDNRKNIVLDMVLLNRCRYLLQLQPNHQENLAINIQQYMEQRIKIEGKVNYHKFCQFQEDLKPLDVELSLLQHRTSYQDLQSNYLNKILYFWGKFLLDENRLIEQNNRQKFKAFSIIYFKKICSYIFLMKLDETHIFLYFRIYYLMHNQQYASERQFTSFRHVFDQLLTIPKIKFNNLKFLLIFSRIFDFNNTYYSRSKEIINFIYLQLPPNILNKGQDNQKILQKLFLQLQKFNEIPQQFMTIIPKCFDSHPSMKIRLRAFCLMLQFYIITKDNITGMKDINQIIKRMTSQIGLYAFKEISRVFSRADIWLPQFWHDYFLFMGKYDHWKSVGTFYHYIYDDLLVNMGLGGVQLKQAALKFRNTLASNKIFLEKIDIKDEYYKIFGKNLNNSMKSIQAHISTSLKLICASQILDEVQIKYFRVDILVNKKIIIQINNESHYKRINNELKLNLKSSFRERILRLSGYQFKNILTTDYSSAHYSMYQEIHAIVQSTGHLKYKKQII